MGNFLHLRLKPILALAALAAGLHMTGQGTLSNPVFSENFGTLANGTNLSPANTAFSQVRLGGADDEFDYVRAMNPGTFTGASGAISTAGNTVSTVDKTGLDSFSSGTYTFKFKTPADLTYAVLFSAIGWGNTFGSVHAFNGSQLAAAFQVHSGNLQVRTNQAWTTIQAAAPNTAYHITLVFNNTGSSMNYGNSRTLPSNKCHIWLNGTYVDEYSSAIANRTASAFRIYTQTGQFEVDDIAVYNTLPAAANTPAPALSTNAAALSFGEVITQESASQSFNVSAVGLTGAPGQITVASDSADFEVSADNVTFGPSISIGYTTATLVAIPVFVRFAPETTGAKTGTLTISGGGAATSPTVSLTGTGIVPAPAATAATEISNRSFRANWNTVDVADSYRLDVIIQGSSPLEYVAGYENLLVEGPSQLVTGLEPNTLYTYRVRMVAGAETSGNSNTIDVTTTNFNTWDGAAWSLGTPPTVADNAFIEGDYNTGTEAPIEALNLTIDSGELTVAAETVVTVANALTVGNGTVVVESNGMLMQAGTTNQNSGAVEVHRDSHPLYRGDYTMWSAPVAGQNVFNFSSGTVLSRFYTYNTTTNHLESMFATQQDTQGVNFAAGQGYLIRMPNGSDVEGYIAGTAPMTFDGEFTGVPNNGDIPVTLSADGLGFNAIGNPYPSMIDADEFLQRNAIDNQRIDGTLYFWRKKNGVEGDAYATYTYVGGAAGSGTPGSSDDPELEEPILTEVPNGRIQTGQGFLVKALMAGSQPLFANTLRMADFSQDDQFFRMANTTGVVKHRMWLNLKNPAGLVFQSLVGYMTGATNGLDTAIDGKRFDEAAAGFYSVADAAKLTIQGRALPFMASDVVPMGYKALTAGSHTITLSNMDGLFAEGQDIFLKDNVLGVTHNLKEAGYTFATEAGTFDERFEIVYAQALGTDTPVLDANSIVVYKQGSAINISSGTIEMTGVAVYDIQGRELYSKTGINSTEAVITNLQSAQQVLIVQITTAKNGKVSKKIVF